MPKLIALFNQAGGVAKTTLTINLGYHLHLRKHQVLLVDMDPQASLTTFMGLEPHKLDQTIAEAILSEPKNLPIHHNLHGLNLIPSNIALSAAEIELVAVMAREMRLLKAWRNCNAKKTSGTPENEGWRCCLSAGTE